MKAALTLFVAAAFFGGSAVWSVMTLHVRSTEHEFQVLRCSAPPPVQLTALIEAHEAFAHP